MIISRAGASTEHTSTSTGKSVLESFVFSIFMFIILGKTRTRVVFIPSLIIRCFRPLAYISTNTKIFKDLDYLNQWGCQAIYPNRLTCPTACHLSWLPWSCCWPPNDRPRYGKISVDAMTLWSSCLERCQIKNHIYGYACQVINHMTHILKDRTLLCVVLGTHRHIYWHRADSRFTPSQSEMVLLCLSLAGRKPRIGPVGKSMSPSPAAGTSQSFMEKCANFLKLASSG